MSVGARSRDRPGPTFGHIDRLSRGCDIANRRTTPYYLVQRLKVAGKHIGGYIQSDYDETAEAFDASRK
jgi:hypothetical protein